MSFRLICGFLLATFIGNFAVHAESLSAFLSQKTYEIQKGEACQKDNSLRYPPKTDQAMWCSAADLKIQDIGDVSEKLFFDESAREYLRRNQCWDQKIESLDADKKAALVEEAKEILPLLGDINKQLKNVRLDRSRYVQSEPPSTQDSARNKKRGGKIAEFDAQEATLTQTLNKIISASWYGDHYLAKKKLLEMADKAGGNLEEYVKSLNVKKLEQDLLSPIQRESLQEQRALLKTASLGGSSEKIKSPDKKSAAEIRSLDISKLSFDLGDTQKIKLFKENNMGTFLLKRTPADIKYYSNLYCQLEGRYGEGRDSFNNIRMGAELALSLGLPIAPYVAAARGMMSLRTASFVSNATATGIASYDIFKAYQEECGPDLRLKTGATCDSAKIPQENFTHELSQGSCYLQLGLAGANFVSPAAIRVWQKIKAREKALDKALSSPHIVNKADNAAAKYGDDVADTWKKHSAHFQQHIKANIENMSSAYKEAIENNHPQIRSLEKLGYKFKISGDKVIADVPPFEEVVSNYNKIMQYHIASGRIKEEDILTPVRVFENKDKKILMIKYGDPVPKGYRPAKSALLKDEDFAKAIGDGLLPIGEFKREPGFEKIPFTALEHDVGHLTAYMDRPEYMAALRQAFKQRAATYDSAEPVNYSRLFYASELHEQLNPKNAMFFNKFLADNKIPSAPFKEKFVTVDQVRKSLSGKSYEEIRGMLDNLAKRNFAEPIGGSRRDLGTVEQRINSGVANSYSPFNNFFETPNGFAQRGASDIRTLERRYFEGRRVSESEITDGAPDAARESLARALTTLHNSKQLDPVTVVKESARPKIDKSSSIYKYFCKSGAFDQYDEWQVTSVYMAYCMED